MGLSVKCGLCLLSVSISTRCILFRTIAIIRKGNNGDVHELLNLADRPSLPRHGNDQLKRNDICTCLVLVNPMLASMIHSAVNNRGLMVGLGFRLLSY